MQKTMDKAWDQYFDSMLEEATDTMMGRQIKITPAKLASFFTKHYELDLNEKEAKDWLESHDWYKRSQALEKCLEAFLRSPDFGEGCKAATKASWGGSGYSVELFADGTWRVLWDNEIGNLYESPGEIISLPVLNDDDYQECVVDRDMTEDDYFFSVFQNDEEELKQGMRDKLAGVA